MKKIIITLLLGLIPMVSPNRAAAADYRYSQYCLRGLRDQFHLDEHYPEFAAACADGTEFLGNIDDPELYRLAGSAYIHGASPTAINWELQPLIKYIYGLAVVCGQNPLLIQKVFFLWLLYLIYLLGRSLLPKKSKYISLLPVLLFALDPLVGEQLSQTFLDLGQTFFIYLYFSLFLGWLTYKRSIVPAMLTLGCVALSKSFSVGALIVGFSGVYLYVEDRNRLSLYLRSLWQPVVVYLLGYSAFFFSHSLVDFLTLHIDILKYYKSYVPEYPKGEIFRIIFSGQWRTWYGDKGLIPSPGWSIFWPLSLVITFVGLKTFVKRAPIIYPLLAAWILVYLAFISLRLVFPRYLLPVLPALYLCLTAAISGLVPIYSNPKSRNPQSS